MTIKDVHPTTALCRRSKRRRYPGKNAHVERACGALVSSEASGERQGAYTWTQQDRRQAQCASTGWKIHQGVTVIRAIAVYESRPQGIGQGEDQFPLTINTRRIYILPTRGGVAFAALLFIMLLAGLNYANSIALLITFLLSGFALIAMHLCHRNLANVAVRGVSASNAFAGEHGRLSLTLENAADTARIGLECQVDGSERVVVSVPPDSTARADLAVMLERRGRLRIERIKLSTAFPFGLFRAWTWVSRRACGSSSRGGASVNRTPTPWRPSSSSTMTW